MRRVLPSVAHGTRADANQRELAKYIPGNRAGTAHRGTPDPCAERPPAFPRRRCSRWRRHLYSAGQDDSHRPQSFPASLGEARLVRLEASLTACLHEKPSSVRGRRVPHTCRLRHPTSTCWRGHHARIGSPTKSVSLGGAPPPPARETEIDSQLP